MVRVRVSVSRVSGVRVRVRVGGVRVRVSVIIHYNMIYRVN